MALVLTAAVIGITPGAEAAPIYNWTPWTSTSGTSASAGSVTLSTSSGVNTIVTTPFPIQFDGVPFTPTDAPSAIVSNIGGETWSFEIDFTSVPDTTGLIVGLGNFAHDSGWSYRLDAYDAIGGAIALTDLTQIGSFDHTWTVSGLEFNDDVVLNTATGIFDVTAVALLNDVNSDILLMSLGAGIGRLVISTVGTPGVGMGDAVNVLVASPVPLPAALPLFGTGLGILGFLGWRRRRKAV